MTTLEALERWRVSGAISGEQHAALAAIVRNDRFSVFLELNALLYLGVLSFVGGLGWTIHEHFAQLGDAAIVVPLALIFAACLYYCITRSRPYQNEQVESPGFAFDYVLYLGCLVFATELAYLEFRFALLKAHWDYYLLASAALYFVLAYRFDNRFVLSLALSTLGAWFGVRLFFLGMHIGGSTQGDVLSYAAVSAAAGFATYRLGIKPHFFETYLHISANAALGALASGSSGGEASGWWTIALVLASAATIERGVHLRKFAFVVYGFVYGYWGVSAQILRGAHDATAVLLYFVVSGIMVLASLVMLSRRAGREE